MSTYIKLVQNDDRPSLVVTLTDEESGEPINITGCEIRLYFRLAGETALKGIIPGQVLNGATGLGIFHWSSVPDILDGEPGVYQGEIKIIFPDGTVQTAWDILKFKLREKF